MTGRGTDLIKASVWFVCVCAVLGFVSVTDFAEPRSKPSTPMVIFSVGEYHTADPVTRKAVTSQGIDPIVIIEGKTYKKPPSDKNELVKFGNSYYRLGQTYRLLFGGSEAGKISVKKWSESDLLADGCYDAGAEVEIKSSVKFADGIGALATNSKVL